MRTNSGRRAKQKFSPQVEELENRLLLAANGLIDDPVLPGILPPQANQAPMAPLGGYETIVGAMPLVTTLAWFDWYEQLRDTRLNYVLQPRSANYYFAADGDDVNGLGTPESPFQSLAKAQQLLNSSGGNIAILFKRGDEFLATVGLEVMQEHVTIGAWGDEQLPKPMISAFTIKYDSGGWTQVPGTNRWTMSAPDRIGWIRDATNDDARLSPFTYLRSTAAVEANARSWWWDGATLHFNPGVGVDPNTVNYEAVGDVEDRGIEVRGDGSVVMDIRADGWGCVAGEQYQDWGISLWPVGTNTIACINCEAYYNGRHGLSIHGRGISQGGFALVLNSSTGYSNATAAGVTQFNTFNPYGQTEAIWENNTVRFGKLPDSSLIGGGFDDSPAFYAHNGGNSPDIFDLYINVDGRVTAENLPGATYSAGRSRVEPRDARGNENDLSSLRAIFVNYDVVHGLNERIELPLRNVFVNSNFTMTLQDSEFISRTGGWYINTIFNLTDTLAMRRFFMAGSEEPTAHFIHSSFRVDGVNNPQNHDWQLLVNEPDDLVQAANNLFVRTNQREFSIGIENDAQHLLANGYYQILNVGAEGYSGDPYRRELTSFPEPNQAPTLAMGLVGFAKPSAFGIPVEYDYLGQTRLVDAPTIGAVEFDWDALPTGPAGQYYIARAGRPLTLTALVVPDPLATYTWDLNGDGIYTDATGLNPTLSWSQVAALGLAAGVQEVRLRTTVGGDVTTSAPAVLFFSNQAPFADAGPSISIFVGENINLDASKSFAFQPDDALVYEWDVNGDGIYGDVTGVTPTVTPTQYGAIGLVEGTLYNVRVRVSLANAPSVFTISTAIPLQFSPPLTAEAGGPYNGTEGVPLTLTALDNGPFPTYEWDLDNNGTYETPGRVVSFTPPDSGTYTVGLRVSAGSQSLTDTAIVNSVETPPRSGSAMPGTIQRGDYPVKIDVIDGLIDMQSNYTFELDWDANGIWDQTVVGPAGMTVNHAFLKPGINVFFVRATDSQNVTGPIGFGITNVIPYEVINNRFVWYGSDQADQVTIQTTTGSSIRVMETLLAGSPAAIDLTFSNIVGVEVHGKNGNDEIDLSGYLGNATTYGGLGKDTIRGAQGVDTIYGDEVDGKGDADLIFGNGSADLILGDGSGGEGNAADTIHGGDGADTIFADGAEGAKDVIYGDDGDDYIDAGGGDDFADGGNGNDIILGGDGAEGSRDTLLGSDGRDFLVGDVLDPAVTQNEGGLDSISGGNDEDLIITDRLFFSLAFEPYLWRAEWTSASSYEDRVAHLTGTPGGINGTSYLKPGINILDDLVIDIALGDAGRDLIFGNNGVYITEA